MFAPAKRLYPATIESAHIPAPIGGINQLDAGTDMPDLDCIYAYNLIGAEYGLRVRLGHKEWCTGLTGYSDNLVRSTLPFVGSHKNGSTNKQFATTSTGIWDVSASSSSPTQVVTFGTHTGEAGYGISNVVSTPAGRFLVYCDEENGLYIYTENTASWAKISVGVTQAWAPLTGYLSGNTVVNGGKVYTCTVAGTSGNAGGPTGTGTGITDGSVTWNYVSASSSSVIGPSLADQNAGYTGDPANFVFAGVWKSRLWFVERDTSRAWYLNVNSIYGTATSFDFGSKMRAGGPLVGLWNWSFDGGAGLDTLLVGLSAAGDVVIYQGTDPTSATTFGLKGSWSVGGVPYGRHIATDFGGDLLVLSLQGLVPLSKLIIGNPIVDRTQYATAKIANLFNLLASTSKSLPGWGVYAHPTDNALIITVPTAAGQATTQLAMSFATKGWSLYRDLPIYSAGVWDGKLYFGTADGRVCVNDGYVDGVLLSDANAFTPVGFSLLTAFRNLGNARQKRVQMIRPQLITQASSVSYQAAAKFDFDLGEIDPPSAATGTRSTGSTFWDSATWDAAVWSGDYNAAATLMGSTGIGRAVAIAVRGQATARTTLVGFDVLFQQGGLL